MYLDSAHHGLHNQVARSVEFKLTTPGGGATAIERPVSLQRMRSYQYFFVVLTQGARFDYLDKRLDSIRLHYPGTEITRDRDSTKW